MLLLYQSKVNSQILSYNHIEKSSSERLNYANANKGRKDYWLSYHNKYPEELFDWQISQWQRMDISSEANEILNQDISCNNDQNWILFQDIDPDASQNDENIYINELKVRMI